MKCCHCGASVQVTETNTAFCSAACENAYEFITRSGLNEYYKTDHFGVKPQEFDDYNYEHFEKETVINLVSDKYIGIQKEIVFYIPQMRDQQDVWLLSKLYNMNVGIGICVADLKTKSLKVAFDSRLLTVKHIIETLNMIGFPPELEVEREHFALGSDLKIASWMCEKLRFKRLKSISKTAFKNLKVSLFL